MTPHRRTKKVWYNMLDRCNNLHCKSYKYYGGRGIKVLYRSFDDFVADVGHAPEGLQIDRIENNKGYQLGNCRWTTVLVNMRNRRKVTLTESLVSEIKYLINLGIKSNIIADQYNVCSGTIRQIRRGFTWTEVQPFPMGLYVKRIEAIA